MKKQSRLFPIAIGVVAMVLGTLVLPSCMKESFSDYQDDDAIEMVINVGANTKTTNSDTSTLWAEGDQLSVIHSAAGGSDFWSSAFTLKPGTNNTFSGKVSRLSSTNDWYLVYPYQQENKAANQLKLTFPASQTQTGNANMAHFAGPGFPMFGKSLGVEKGVQLNVTMANVLAAADFKVVNTTESPIIVKEIQFTATYPVAGEFTMDITGDDPVLTVGSGATKVVTLTVENGEKIEPSQNSEFYLAVAPFIVPDGGSLNYKITAVHEGSDTPIVFYDTKTLEEGTTFTAGLIKTVNVNFDENHTTNPDAGSAGEVELEVGEEPEDGVYLLVYEDEDGGNSMAFAAFAEYESNNYAIPVVVDNGVVIRVDADRYNGNPDNLELSTLAVTIENAGLKHPSDPTHDAYNVRNTDDKFIFYSSQGGNITAALQIKDINEMDIDGTTYKYYHTFVGAEDGVQIMSSIAITSGSSTGTGTKYLLTYSDSKGFHYSSEQTDLGKKLHLYAVGETTPSLPQTLEFDQTTIEYDFDHPSDFPEPELSGDYHTTVIYTSDNESIAKVNPDTGEVEIVGPGTTTITATAPAGMVNGVKYKTATASYTIRSNSNQGQKFYLTTELVDGGTYVIVSSGKALANNGGSIGVSEETFSGDEIVVKNASAMTWEATASGSGFTLLNNGKYLQRSSSTPSIGNKPTTDRYYIWKYSSSKLTMASGTAYSLYYSSGWKLSSTNAGSVSLYSSTKPLTPQNINFAEDSVIKIWGEDCNQGDTFPVQTVSNAQTSVTYESSNSNVATISGTTITVVGKGSTTITATAKEENGFKKATATYSMHITDPAPAGFKHMGFFNLENDDVKAYLTAAASQYDNTINKTIVADYAYSVPTHKDSDQNNLVSAADRIDVPNPVHLNWADASTGAATVTIYSNQTMNAEDIVWTQTTTSGSTSADVYNLIPGETYYCMVVDTDGDELLKGVFTTEGRRRMIRLSDRDGKFDRANNFRDLGGMVTADGKKRIKYGWIFRGTNLNGTNDAEQGVMANNLNIGWDIDLRMSTEGSMAFASKYEVTYVMCDYNASISALTSDKSKVKKTVKAFIDAAKAGKASYFHCRIGSDRTGYWGLLIEGLLGVSAKECSIDYELTSFANGVTSGNRTRNTGLFKDGMDFITGKSYYKNPVTTDDYYTDNLLQYAITKYLIDEIDISEADILAFQNAVLEDI